MNIHWFQHVPFEGLGSIEAWARAGGHQITSTQFYTDNPLPSLNDVDWLIIMGGPMNVYEEERYPWLVKEKRFIGEAIEAGKIVLGICLGAQLIADVLGAKIYPNAYKEIGWFPIQKTEEAKRSRIFEALPSKIEVFHWHGDTFDLPAGAVRVARSAACENQAFIYNKRVVGLQFHLETTRQAAEQLIAHCANENVEGPFIQTPDTMLSNERRFERINEVMRRLLDMLCNIPP